MKYNVSLGDVDRSVEPVTLAMAKANSNIEHSDSDTYLQLLLDTSISEAESYTGRAIFKRPVNIRLERFEKEIVLPYGPIISITSLVFVDENGVDTIVDALMYDIVPCENGQSAILYFKADPPTSVSVHNPMPVKVNALAGYGTADEVPWDIKKAILLIFSQQEMYREDMPLKADKASRALLRPYRRY